MKTLDLNAYGVSEMTKQEMMETDGGRYWGPLGAALLIIDAVRYFVEGFNERMDELNPK